MIFTVDTKKYLLNLYKKTLETKWIPKVQGLYYEECSFCKDVDYSCSVCLINKEICDYDSNNQSLYRKIQLLDEKYREDDVFETYGWLVVEALRREIKKLEEEIKNAKEL